MTTGHWSSAPCWTRSTCCGCQSLVGKARCDPHWRVHVWLYRWGNSHSIGKRLPTIFRLATHSVPLVKQRDTRSQWMPCCWLSCAAFETGQLKQDNLKVQEGQQQWPLTHISVGTPSGYIMCFKSRISNKLYTNSRQIYVYKKYIFSIKTLSTVSVVSLHTMKRRQYCSESDKK